MVCMALAGRASEQINFGEVTTGASDDLRRVTQIVYQMVQVYGMNSKVGQLSFPRESGEWPQEKLYSDSTSEMIDVEVRSIVNEAYERTLKLIESKKDQVKSIAELLLEKETITNADVANLIGPRPFSPGKEYEEYLSHGWNKFSESGSDKKEDDTQTDINNTQENDPEAKSSSEPNEAQDTK